MLITTTVKRLFASSLLRSVVQPNHQLELIMSDHSTRNAQGYELTSAFEEQIAFIKQSPDIRSVLLRSDNRDYFCSGGNLRERAKMSHAEVDTFTSRLRNLYKSLESLPVPTIALISGFVMGGGLELALSTDMRVAVRGGQFSLPQCRIGSIPGLGGIRRLRRIVGESKAKEMVFTGEKVDAVTAHRFGLVNDVCDTYDQAYARCAKLGEDIASCSRMSIAEAKKVFVVLGQDVEGETMETDAYRRLILNSEREAAIKKFVSRKKK